MTSQDPSTHPRLVSLQLTESAHGYLTRALNLGAVEGSLGAMQVTPEVATLLQALNAILAGGKVTVEVESRGNPDVFAELNQRLEAAARDANAVNAAAGYYVAAVP